jgi:gamma-glutamyl hercynylcysteine S-oxide synthase
MSPLVWDLGHIAAFEDLWLGRRLGGLPLLRRDLMQVYDAFETPRCERGDAEFLPPAEAFAYLEAVRARVEDVPVGDGRLHDLVLRHEQQHVETMLQTLELAHLDPSALPEPASPTGHVRLGAPADLDFVEVPGGPCLIGAGPEGFSYDNERPRHQVDVPAFLMARAPVTNATWRHFTEGGGYERREWWTDEGWAWKEDEDIHGPAEWTAGSLEWRLGEGLVPIDPVRPVVHVSWFEADAFARAHGARLPSEAEWEKAATWDQSTGVIVPPDPAPGDLGQRGLGTAPIPAAAVAPSGCAGMLGGVWEWTASDFTGYPGFVADPYREYSEPFFGPDYKVLRGGSWATRRRVASATFRNWDFPGRRQIFSGLRLAK